MLFKTTILALAAFVTVGMALPQMGGCPGENVCTNEGALKCRRFGHGTAVYECKNKCWFARDVCPAEGMCIAGKEPHCT